MEVAVRWSPLSTPSNGRFLIVDVGGRSFKHHQVTGYKDSVLEWQEISRFTKAPSFRVFDWLPSQDVVAVGQASGESNILHLSSGLQVLSLPIKSQRQCNAVAFNSGGLLATGLERVRNDFCLNIYDVNQRLIKQPNNVLTPRAILDPVRRLATSEGITSIKFFAQQPDTLIAGVKGTCLRIYDLRDSASGPSRQFQTTCVHNLAIDPTDENYFASAGPLKDTTVLVWDRRSTVRPLLKKDDKPVNHEGPILEIGPLASREKTDQPSIWSLRFSGAESGCLGVLLSSGQFGLYKTKKDYNIDQRPASKGSSDANSSQEYVQHLHIENALTVERPAPQRRLSSTTRDRDGAMPIVSFDFTNVLTLSKQPCAIILRRNQDVGIYEIKRRTTGLAMSSRNAVAVSKSRSGISTVSGQPSLQSRLALQQAGQSKLTENGVSGIINEAPLGRDELRHLETLKAAATLAVADESRQRAIRGYLLDCRKNANLLKDYPDMREMWQWISLAHEMTSSGVMVFEDVDFSYLGVFGLWNYNLGQIDTRVQFKKTLNVPIKDTIIRFSQSFEDPTDALPKTSQPHLRMLCLRTLGFSPLSDLLKNAVEKLASNGENIQACLLSLMLGNRELAHGVLETEADREGDTERALSLGISFLELSNDSNSQGEHATQVLKRLKRTLKNVVGPYAAAIAAYVSCGGDWKEALRMESLPLRYRVGIALISLNDRDLSNYLSGATNHALSNGNLQGVVLTGLSDRAVDLFETYLRREGDVQTAVLALSFAAPRFIRTARCGDWRQRYREQLNSWGLYLERSQFDMLSTKLSTTSSGEKLIRPTPRQISIRCNKCGEALHRDLPSENMSVASNTQSQAKAHKVFGESHTGTMCPRCHAHLPRCAICDLWLGVPNQRSAGAAEVAGKDRYHELLDVCLTCKHMYHRGHAQEWFTTHDKCPVPDCECWCNRLDA